MQSCSFREKITKQHSVVLKQLSRFRTAWEGRAVEPGKIDTYCNLVDYITDLHSTYVYSCMQYSTPQMRQEMLQVNRTIVDDLIKKVKQLSQLNKKSLKNYLDKEKKQLCQICSTKIREVDVRIIKDQLSDEASLRRTLLKKIYADIQNGNDELFSKDDDEMFFQFLKRILVKKQELLAMQTKEINDFLFEVTKSFSDMNFLTEFTPGKYGESGFRENYKDELSRTITNTLKNGFEQKIHPWMQKVFENVKKQILTQKNKLNPQKSTQTQDDLNYHKKRTQYLSSVENKREIQHLKEQIQQSTLTIAQLKSKLLVIQKQKKQLQEYYAEQVKGLLMEKRQVEIKLRKTETDFFGLKQTNEEISQVNRRLRKQRKKTYQSISSKKSIKDKAEISKKGSQKNLQNGQMERKMKKKKTKINKLLSKQTSQLQLFMDDDKDEDGEFVRMRDDEKKTSMVMMSKTTGGEFIMDNNMDEDPLELGQQQQTEFEKIKSKTATNNMSHSLSRKQKSRQNSLKVQFKLHQQQQSTNNNSNTQKLKQKRFSMNPNRLGQQKRSTIEAIGGKDHQKQQHLQQQVTNNNNGGYPNKLLKKRASFMNTNNLSNLSFIAEQHNNESNQQHNANIYHGNGSSNQGLLKVRRNLSIQAGLVSPGFLAKRPTIQHHNLLQNSLSQQLHPIDEGLSIVKEQSFFVSRNSRSSILPQQKKRVFQFVPLQNQVEYEQLKQKMTQVTAKMQSKTTGMLRSSIRNINLLQHFPNLKVYHQQQQHQGEEHEEESEASFGELGRVYGHSMVLNPATQQIRNSGASNSNKKSNQSKNNRHSRQKSGSQQSHSLVKGGENKFNQRTRLNNNDNESNSDSGSENCIKQKQQQRHHVVEEKIKEQEKKTVVVKERNSQEKQQKKEEKGNMESLIDHVQVKDRIKVYQQLKKQSVIPNTLTFEHYELMVRKLFAEIQNQQHNSNSIETIDNLKSNHTRTSSSSNNYNSNNNTSNITNTNDNLTSNNSYTNINTKMKQNQSSGKINIDSKFLDYENNKFNKIHQSKMLLNLPKLEKLPHNNKFPIRSQSTNKTILNINTMREKINLIRGDILSNDIKVTPPENDHQSNQQNIIRSAQASPTLTIATKSSAVIINTPKPKSKQKHNNNEIFDNKDLQIFFDTELMAYQYQQMTKSSKINNKSHQQKDYKSLQKQLSEQQKKTIQSLYSIVMQIRLKNHQIYHKICSFLKSPYQTVKHGFDFISIGKDISFEKWGSLLLRIYGLRYSKDEKLSFRQFIKPFQEKIVELIVMINHNNNSE